MKPAVLILALIMGFAAQADQRDLSTRFQSIAEQIRDTQLSLEQRHRLDELADQAESILANDNGYDSINPIVKAPNASFTNTNSGSCSGNSLMGGYFYIYRYDYAYVYQGQAQPPQLQLQTQGTLGSSFTLVDSGIFKKYVIYKNENFVLAVPWYSTDKVMFKYVPNAQTQKYIDYYGNDWKSLCDQN